MSHTVHFLPSLRPQAARAHVNIVSFLRPRERQMGAVRAENHRADKNIHALLIKVCLQYTIIQTVTSHDVWKQLDLRLSVPCSTSKFFIFPWPRRRLSTPVHVVLQLRILKHGDQDFCRTSSPQSKISETQGFTLEFLSHDVTLRCKTREKCLPQQQFPR